MDVYEPPSSGGAQIVDLNPGIRSDGLFWTAVLAPETVTCNLSAGTATMEVKDMHIKDFHDFVNAINGDGPQPKPAVLSFKAVWKCQGAPSTRDVPGEKYRGTMIKQGGSAGAQMEWTARIGDLDYVSGPLATSTSDNIFLLPAEVGQEYSGSYY